LKKKNTIICVLNKDFVTQKTVNKDK